MQNKPPSSSQTLRFRWLDANAESALTETNPAVNATPVCGWIIPNHLENSLMIFDEKGAAEGSILIVNLTEGARTKSLRWDNVPGSNKPLGAGPDLANKHLQGFVNAILDSDQTGTKETALEELLVYLDQAQARNISSLQQSENSLSVLVGEPLALVRADVKTEREAGAANDVNEKTNEVVLGAAEPENDNLLGYFSSADDQQYPAAIYQHLHLPFSSPLLPKDSAYLVKGQIHLLATTVDAAPTSFTLLVRPNGLIYFRRLQSTDQQVPVWQKGIAEALYAMQISFRTGPMLTNQQAINVSLPKDVSELWSWKNRNDKTEWNKGE